LKIVGSFFGIHDNGFSIIEDNNIIACYSEERFSRIKTAFNQFTFPKLSLEAIQKDFNFDINDPEIILAAAKPVNTELQEVLDIVNNRPIKLYSHHYSHACGSYYTSGFDDDTLVISYDGGDCGEDNFIELNSDNLNKYWPYKKNTYNGFYRVKDGKLIEIDADNKWIHGSVTHLWPIFCHILGFQNLKDEGKIMGLAAQGEFDEKIFNQLKYIVDNNYYGSGWIIMDYYIKLLNAISPVEQLKLRRNLSYNLQYITELTMVKLIDDLNKKYGPFKNLCVAGGIFANVKLNQKINEQLPFEEMWVYPAMGDEGVSLGSAIACGVEMGVFKNRRIDNVFLGKNYSKSELNDSLKNFKKTYNKTLFSEKLNYNKIAELLVEGNVIGIFDGSSEYGPRALGNRSIMVEPTKKETHEYINMRLKRDEIMPFAPIILEEHINDICYYEKSKYASEFMTMCYNVKEEWLSKIPAVINIYDGTARPQVVNKKHTHFYNILTKFNELTGIPVLMNTSFNGHGEPIINSPKDALDHLSNGTIDYLIINNKICNING
jgi:carbamoyltransferase